MQELMRLAEGIWPAADKPTRQRIAPLAAGAAWNLRMWSNMEDYTTVLPENVLLFTSLRSSLFLADSFFFFFFCLMVMVMMAA